jgi:hypothetical protein
MVKAAWDVLGPQPDLALTQWALGSPLAGNLALAVLFFPFLLQINAWHYSGVSHQNRDEGLRATAQLAVFGLATLFLGLAVLRLPVEDRGRVEAPAVVRLQETPRPDLWKATVRRSGFLDRTVWSLRFEGSTLPEALTVTLSSREALTVFDCSFPLTLDAEGTQAHIIIGRQPPLPLDLRITLPRQTSAWLDVRMSLEGETRAELVDRIELAP